MSWTDEIAATGNGYQIRQTGHDVDAILAFKGSDEQILAHFKGLTAPQLAAARAFDQERDVARKEVAGVEASLRERFVLIPKWKWATGILGLLGLTTATVVTSVWAYAKASGEYALQYKLEQANKEAGQHIEAIKLKMQDADARVTAITQMQATAGGYAKGFEGVSQTIETLQRRGLKYKTFISPLDFGTTSNDTRILPAIDSGRIECVFYTLRDDIAQVSRIADLFVTVHTADPKQVVLHWKTGDTRIPGHVDIHVFYRED